MTSIESQKNWFTESRSTKIILPSYLEVKKMVLSYFQPEKHCCSYLERVKSGSLLFGHQKMQFTTVKIKEKDYDII